MIALASQHPAWCDRSRCTATETPTSQQYREAAGRCGQHVGAAVALDLVDTFGLTDLGPLAAWLSQQIAPWPCSTFLSIGSATQARSNRPGDDLFAMNVESTSPTVLAQLLTLVEMVCPAAHPEGGAS